MGKYESFMRGLGGMGSNPFIGMMYTGIAMQQHRQQQYERNALKEMNELDAGLTEISQDAHKQQITFNEAAMAPKYAGFWQKFNDKPIIQRAYKLQNGQPRPHVAPDAAAMPITSDDSEDPYALVGYSSNDEGKPAVATKNASKSRVDEVIRIKGASEAAEWLKWQYAKALGLPSNMTVTDLMEREAAMGDMKYIGDEPPSFEIRNRGRAANGGLGAPQITPGNPDPIMGNQQGGGEPNEPPMYRDVPLYEEASVGGQPEFNQPISRNVVRGDRPPETPSITRLEPAGTVAPLIAPDAEVTEIGAFEEVPTTSEEATVLDRPEEAEARVNEVQKGFEERFKLAADRAKEARAKAERQSRVRLIPGDEYADLASDEGTGKKEYELAYPIPGSDEPYVIPLNAEERQAYIDDQQLPGEADTDVVTEEQLIRKSAWVDRLLEIAAQYQHDPEKFAQAMEVANLEYGLLQALERKFHGDEGLTEDDVPRGHPVKAAEKISEAEARRILSDRVSPSSKLGRSFYTDTYRGRGAAAASAYKLGLFGTATPQTFTMMSNYARYGAPTKPKSALELETELADLRIKNADYIKTFNESVQSGRVDTEDVKKFNNSFARQLADQLALQSGLEGDELETWLTGMTKQISQYMPYVERDVLALLARSEDFQRMSDDQKKIVAMDMTAIAALAMSEWQRRNVGTPGAKDFTFADFLISGGGMDQNWLMDVINNLTRLGYDTDQAEATYQGLMVPGTLLEDMSRWATVIRKQRQHDRVNYLSGADGRPTPSEVMAKQLEIERQMNQQR